MGSAFVPFISASVSLAKDGFELVSTRAADATDVLRKERRFMGGLQLLLLLLLVDVDVDVDVDRLVTVLKTQKATSMAVKIDLIDMVGVWDFVI